jgi:outer membrane protein assembly factor BamB
MKTKKKLLVTLGMACLAFAFNLASNAQTPGTLKWRYPAGGDSSATLSADGSTIYFGSTDNKIYALNTDGSVKWSYTTGGQVLTKPCVAPDGTIYVGSLDSTLYALNPNGTLKWTYLDTWSPNPFYGSCTLGADGTIYFGSDDYFMHAVNPNGTLKWMVQANAGFALTAPAVGPDGTIYFHENGAALYALSSAGSVKWTVYPFGDYNSPTVGPDGTIYIGMVYPGLSGEGGTGALNPNGSVKWSSGGALYDVYDTPAIGPDGTIYVGQQSGGLQALNGADGTQKWDSGTGDISVSSPAIAPNGVVVYIGDLNGVVYSVNSSGSQLWTYTTGAAIYSTPTVGPDGTVYVQSTDGYFYALYGSIIPARPIGLAASPANSSVMLTWTASSGATSYNVKRSTTSGGPYTTIASPTSNSYTDTGLANGTAYYYVVSAVNTGGESANSSQAGPVTPVVPVVTAGVGSYPWINEYQSPFQPGTSCSFTFSIPTAQPSALVVYFEFSGTAYPGLGGNFWVGSNATDAGPVWTVTIPAGQTSVAVDVLAVYDPDNDPPTCTGTATILGDPPGGTYNVGSPSSASIFITDNY